MSDYNADPSVLAEALGTHSRRFKSFDTIALARNTFKRV